MHSRPDDRSFEYGIVVAIPAMAIGYWWAVFAGKKFTETVVVEEVSETTSYNPGVVSSFLPVILPIVLIATNSFLVMGKTEVAGLFKILSVLQSGVLAAS